LQRPYGIKAVSVRCKADAFLAVVQGATPGRLMIGP
jgi:hypothetical protein